MFASWRFAGGLCAGLVLGGALPASAQPLLSGEWHAEPMTVRWVIGHWPEACGPRPAGGGDGGGNVTIEERGEELRISGNGRAYSTEQCWEMHPGLSSQSHSRKGRVWQTTCRTAAKDLRQEILETSLNATDDSITFQERGQYQFNLAGQSCTASSGRWRTYTRIKPQERPGAPAVEEPLDSKRAPADPCATPGAPARIEVRPARKLMRGGESFQFRATLLDRRGCPVRAAVSWELKPPGSPGRVADGLLTIEPGAADAELALIATAASQSVQVKVAVVSDERYAGLLASGDFNADGASADAAAATITSGSLGAQPASKEAQSGRKWTFVGLVSAIALGFGALGIWLARRAARQAGRRQQLRIPPPGTGTLVFPGEGGAQTRALPMSDATRLEPQAPTAVVKARTVCPVCGTLYESEMSKVCPRDGARLLPVNA
jgi:hypothetical protein